jgi:hypothetical protein
MPIYNVVMGQGITIANLVGNALVTGIGGQADRVHSCSAVMLANTVNWHAGLFHFPAGNINNDIASQVTLTNMITDVVPNWAMIAWGGEGLHDDEPDKNWMVRGGWQHEQLRAWLLQALPPPVRLSRARAATGIVWLDPQNGIPTAHFGTPVGAVTNLAALAPGIYANYRLY